MNFYEELTEKIDGLLADKKYDEAKAFILNELNLPYVPKDIESKLREYLDKINEATRVYKSLSEQDIEDYLYMDEEHQLLAVDELNKRNLRNYINTCNEYLRNGKYANAKALLIDSLIRQEIDYDFEYVNNGSLLVFNPIKLKSVEKTDGYLVAYEKLLNYYLKDPSMFKMANDLLYKECLLYLPRMATKEEGDICADNIIKYIADAFKG